MLTDAGALRKDFRHSGRVSKLEHRHYAVIAGIIASIGDDNERHNTALHFAHVLAVNPRFDRKRFIAACLTNVYAA